MARNLRVVITTPEEIVHDDIAEEVVVPTSAGMIGILPGHIPLLSVVVPGVVLIKSKKQEVSLTVSQGVLEVRQNQVRILTATVQRIEAEEIAKVSVARLRGEQVMSEKQRESREFAYVVGTLEKSLDHMRAQQNTSK